MAVPEYHSEDWWVLTGTGEDVRFLDMHPYISDDGKPMVRFYFEPNPYVVRKYRLKSGDEIDDKTGLIMQVFPEDWVEIRLDTAKQKRVAISCDLLGRRTKHTEKHASMMTQLDVLRQDNRSLRVALQRKQEELSNARTSIIKTLTELKHIQEVMEKKVRQPATEQKEIQPDDVNRLT